jgi:formamidopyrimidine-DNA glycosylase
MPELPEAETMARDLNTLVAHKTISEVFLAYEPIVAGDSQHFKKVLKGATIESVGRLGKQIRFNFNQERTLLVHLKMTGQFLLDTFKGEDPKTWPIHARAAFKIGKEALYYRDIRKFGRLRAFCGQELDNYLKEIGLGPDPLSISQEDFFSRLNQKKGRLKAVLLDQKIIAGVGNIYADESLFAAGLSPLRPGVSLNREESDLLLFELKRILHLSILNRGSTVENYQAPQGAGSFQDSLKAYGKAGQNCPTCQNPFAKTVVGGRTSVYCPFCQK